MNDLIDRQAAIDAIRKLESGEDFNFNNGLICAMNSVAELPPAEPERIRGRWVYGEDELGIDGYQCNKCGFVVPWYYARTSIDFVKDYHFCPNCGADMRGKQDETD